MIHYKSYGKPAYKLKYDVSYDFMAPLARRPTAHQLDGLTEATPTSSKLDMHVDFETCGELYAQTFLEKFLALEEWLNDLCAEQAPSSLSSTSSSSPSHNGWGRGGGGAPEEGAPGARSKDVGVARVQIVPATSLQINQWSLDMSFDMTVNRELIVFIIG